MLPGDWEIRRKCLGFVNSRRALSILGILKSRFTGYRLRCISSLKTSTNITDR
ncbi:Uncharacterized protein dnm_082960 [Desulfonema magnum]|uniref:Uncharacterized protein n=1 Tax=Desulfonema magnum TaxID=45655 RepID=A0A975GSM7_9BACT|nr:Uncharacterized protein dnm_082960 [Desulfonema magnum]